jgi:hypothetical protein
MKGREFLYLVPDIVRQQLPSELQDFQIVGPTMTLVKLHYGEPAIHYEVWIQKRRGEIELGLHFESDAVTNRRGLEVLNENLEAIQRVAGALAVGEWDKGWTRAHESLDLEPLTDDFLIEVSSRLSAVVGTLEPILRTDRTPDVVAP